MAVTFQPDENPVQVGPDTWRLFWSSDQDDPMYRIFVNGRYRLSTTAEYGDFPMNYFAGESRVVEVLDDADTPASTALDAQILLSWNEVSGAAKYRVQRYVDGAWVAIREIAAGQLRHHYWTPALAGETGTHDFRVTTIGEDDNEATPAVVNVLMTRHPNPPIVDFSFSDGTKKVSIAAA